MVRISSEHLEFDGDDEHLGQLRVHREIGHLAAEGSQGFFGVQRGERVQCLRGGAQDLRRRRVHEVEAGDDVVVRRFGVQPMSFPGVRPSGTTRSLACLCLKDEHHH
jgi:hypothetical protein